MAEEKIVIEVEIDDNAAAQKLSQIKKEISDLRKEQNECSKAIREGNDVSGEMAKKFAENTKRLNELNAAEKDYTQVVITASKRGDNYTDSLNSMSAQLVELKKQYRSLSSDLRDGSTGKDLLQRITELDTKLKDAEASMGEFHRNVGNYTGSMNDFAKTMLGSNEKVAKLAELFGANMVDGLRAGTAGIKAFSKALLSSPFTIILTTVKTLSVVFGQLKARFDENKDAQDRLRAAIERLQPVFNALKSVADAMINTFVNVVDKVSTLTTKFIGLKDTRIAGEDEVRKLQKENHQAQIDDINALSREYTKAYKLRAAAYLRTLKEQTTEKAKQEAIEERIRNLEKEIEEVERATAASISEQAVDLERLYTNMLANEKKLQAQAELRRRESSAGYTEERRNIERTYTQLQSTFSRSERYWTDALANIRKQIAGTNTDVQKAFEALEKSPSVSRIRKFVIELTSALKVRGLYEQSSTDSDEVREPLTELSYDETLEKIKSLEDYLSVTGELRKKIQEAENDFRDFELDTWSKIDKDIPPRMSAAAILTQYNIVREELASLVEGMDYSDFAPVVLEMLKNNTLPSLISKPVADTLRKTMYSARYTDEELQEAIKNLTEFSQELSAAMWQKSKTTNYLGDWFYNIDETNITTTAQESFERIWGTRLAALKEFSTEYSQAEKEATEDWISWYSETVSKLKDSLISGSLDEVSSSIKELKDAGLTDLYGDFEALIELMNNPLSVDASESFFAFLLRNLKLTTEEIEKLTQKFNELRTDAFIDRIGDVEGALNEVIETSKSLADSVALDSQSVRESYQSMTEAEVKAAKFEQLMSLVQIALSGTVATAKAIQVASKSSATWIDMLVAIATSVSTITALIATTVTTVKKLSIPASPKFAEGGIVPGTSYTGDKVHARLNSGEMVLTMEDQKRLLGLIRAPNTTEMSYRVQVQSLKEALSEMKAPVLVYKDFEKFTNRRENRHNLTQYS